ncbi:MAG: group II intron reverse transcriptase/maturase [Chlamydiota bacterium]|nr:group II intron reverse transcriptase/maturase [Chlamydiota bacterium]
MNQAKPFDISKRIVLEAYKRVKANGGARGVDEETIQDFERGLKDNLYKIWNRMSSGSYFPPAVRRVEIPKASGGKRPLGIPTVSDRIAQMVAKQYLEPKLEPYFHKDSYGYRPNRSAIEALGVARERCWRYDWVLDLDIRGFFDNLDHELLMRAVRKHTKCKWVLLYIERWLKAPAQCEDGTLIQRDKGTPQGGVISPLLANLFLHYALDEWMKKNYPGIGFERYADDAVYHCKTEAEAKALKAAIEKRLAECRLELHPEKTKIVYCKDGKRRKEYPEKKFDFLGYTFRPRKAKDYRGQYFCNFSPAVSQRAKKEMSRVIRSWGLQRRSGSTLEDLSREINPSLRGWVNYYGRYYRSGLYPIFRQLECALMKWAMRKYKRFRGQQHAVAYWLIAIAKRSPNLFVHWSMRTS